MSEQAEPTVHTVTLRFPGPLGKDLADHFFNSWLEGEISQVWAESVDDADIAEAIEYDGEAETRTITVEAAKDEDDTEEETSDAEETEDDDASKAA